MCCLRCAALFSIATITFTSLPGWPQAAAQSAASRTASRNQQSISGPQATMNRAVASGATAVVTLQPVPPKTVPASSYPPGSAIMNQTLFLGSVPARVWLEAQITGWAPEVLKTFQVRIDASDLDEDGGGYIGDNADCLGSPMVGAGDLLPAIQSCSTNSDCRATMSGITSPCGSGEPSRCITRPAFFPPGGKVCEFGFFDSCDPRYFGMGLDHIAAVDYGTINTRMGWSFNPPDGALDFHPSYSGTLVLDVPANAKGRYVLDVVETESFMLNQNNPPNNNIPIAQLNVADIRVACGSCCTSPGGQATCTDGLSAAECMSLPSPHTPLYHPGLACDEVDCCVCQNNSDCNDNDACSTDICVGECDCQHSPAAGWDQATECCNPANGVQGPIPQSTACRLGVCSLGGSSGVPGLENRPDGTACSDDPCFVEGQCASGSCIASQYAGSNCPKPRFISFDIETGATPSAYRVRLVSLHHPDPPYTGGPAADFSAFEGQYRWVGVPDSYPESSADSTPVYAAFVACDPYYQDWSAIDLLHVSGAEIVPSSIYEVQSIAEGLDVNIEANYSASTTIFTARWCDVVLPYAPPSATEQPDAADHAALVNKFRSRPGAMSKPRALLVGSGPAGIPSLDFDVSFAEISAAVDAYKNSPYPYSGPTPCP